MRTVEFRVSHLKIHNSISTLQAQCHSNSRKNNHNNNDNNNNNNNKDNGLNYFHCKNKLKNSSAKFNSIQFYPKTKNLFNTLALQFNDFLTRIYHRDCNFIHDYMFLHVKNIRQEGKARRRKKKRETERQQWKISHWAWKKKSRGFKSASSPYASPSMWSRALVEEKSLSRQKSLSGCVSLYFRIAQASED